MGHEIIPIAAILPTHRTCLGDREHMLFHASAGTPLYYRMWCDDRWYPYDPTGNRTDHYDWQHAESVEYIQAGLFDDAGDCNPCAGRNSYKNPRAEAPWL